VSSALASALVHSSHESYLNTSPVCMLSRPWNERAAVPDKAIALLDEIRQSNLTTC
jgi:hypothetical protein